MERLITVGEQNVAVVSFISVALSGILFSLRSVICFRLFCLQLFPLTTTSPHSPHSPSLSHWWLVFFFSLSLAFCLTTLLPRSDPALHSPHSPSGPVEQSCWRTSLNRIELECVLLCQTSQSPTCPSSLTCRELVS